MGGGGSSRTQGGVDRGEFRWEFERRGLSAVVAAAEDPYHNEEENGTKDSNNGYDDRDQIGIGNGRRVALRTVYRRLTGTYKIQLEKKPNTYN